MYQEEYQQAPSDKKVYVGKGIPEEIKVHVYIHQSNSRLSGFVYVVFAIPLLLMTIPAAAFIIRVSGTLLEPDPVPVTKEILLPRYFPEVQPAPPTPLPKN